MTRTKKAEINNEIVALRQFVRQARIRVVNKLTREAKKLRASHHGDERQVNRNRNKAEKLLREVFALKRIKDDEVSKFGILRFDDLRRILEDPLSDDGTRAMVKIVRYKSLSPRIAALRHKYPDCEEYVSLDTREGPAKRNGATDAPRRSVKRNNADDAVEKARIVKDVERKVVGTGDDDAPERLQKKNKVKGRQTEETGGKDAEETKKEQQGKRKTIIRNSVKRLKGDSDSKIVPKIISREATVKRFTEILEEREISEERDICKTEERDESVDKFSKETAEELTETDDFFLNSNKTVPRANPTEEYTNDVSYDKPYPTSKRKKFNDKKESYNERWKGVDRDRIKEQNGANSTRKRNRKTAEESKNGKTVNEETENLHPSWAAKKKQQDILKQGFQGKKIKFDEDQ